MEGAVFFLKLFLCATGQNASDHMNTTNLKCLTL